MGPGLGEGSCVLFLPGTYKIFSGGADLIRHMCLEIGLFLQATNVYLIIQFCVKVQANLSRVKSGSSTPCPMLAPLTATSGQLSTVTPRCPLQVFTGFSLSQTDVTIFLTQFKQCGNISFSICIKPLLV
jgi:hypothetical protein